MARLAVIGNISVDHRHHPGGRHHTALGGAALHIAVSATRAGMPAAPVSVIGTDLGSIHTHPGLAGLDLSGTMTAPGPSASFTLTYDARGNLTGTAARYGVAVGLTDHALRYLAGHRCEWIHVCCRRPLDAARILDVLQGRPVSADFALPSAPAMMAAVAPFLPRVAAVFVNTAEFEALVSSCDIATLELTVVTDGPGPARAFQRGRLVATATPPTTVPVDVTGAGDSLIGAFLAARGDGRDLSESLQAAVAAASSHVGQDALPLPEGASCTT